MLDLAQRLPADRYDVTVASGPGEPGDVTLWGEAADRGIRTVELTALRRPVRPIRDVRAFVQILRLIRRERYDIVHTHVSKAGVLGRLAARMAGVPVIVHTHHGRIVELLDSGIMAGLLLRCERLAARVSSQLVAVSADTEQYLRDLRIGVEATRRIVYNGVDEERFRNEGTPRGDGPLIGVVASVIKDKGADVVLSALPLIRERVPAARLRFVGGGPMLGVLAERVDALGLGDTVELVGHADDVRPHLADFDLVVLASRREGLPLVLLEAMAMGRPVVATTVGGTPEVVLDGETGLLVPPGDWRALADAIVRVLSDTERARRMGEAGRQVVEERFRLSQMVGRIDSMYSELLAARGPSKPQPTAARAADDRT